MHTDTFQDSLDYWRRFKEDIAVDLYQSIGVGDPLARLLYHLRQLSHGQLDKLLTVLLSPKSDVGDEMLAIGDYNTVNGNKVPTT